MTLYPEYPNGRHLPYMPVSVPTCWSRQDVQRDFQKLAKDVGTNPIDPYKLFNRKISSVVLVPPL